MSVRRRAVLVGMAGALLAACSAAPRRPRPLGLLAEPAAHTGPDAVIAALLAGNRRFVTGTPVHGHSAVEARVFARVQHPYAAVLGCADSRVAPEGLFDQGIGDLFVTRTMGGCLDTTVLAALEYAVTELAVPLIVVLGHERCGAIRAAVDVVQARAAAPPMPRPKVPPNLAAVLARLEPAVRSAFDSGASDVHERALRLALAATVRDLGAQPFLRESQARLVAARYDLDDGRVHVLP